MNSLSHYFARMTACLRLGGIVILLLGMNFHAASGYETEKADDKTPAKGKGKIIMMKLSAPSLEKQTQPIGDMPTQPPASAKDETIKHSLKKHSRQASTTPAHSQDADIKPAPMKAVKQPSVDAPVPSPVISQHQEGNIGQPAENHANKISERQTLAEKPIPVADPKPLQPSSDENLMSEVQPIKIDTQKADKISGGALASSKESIQEKVAIITRLLLKLSLITVCCITLFFSFSALQMAKSNR